MLIGHSRVKPAWSVDKNTAGGMPQILSPTNVLADGRPDTATRFKWMTGTPGSGDKLYLRGEWGGAIVPSLIGILNPSLPVGLLITVSFRRSSDSPGGYPYQPTMYQVGGQRIVAGARGERTAWLVAQPGAQPVVGVQIEIWNNVNGNAAVASGAEFSIGDVCICAGTEVFPAGGVTINTIDPTAEGFSWDRQPYTSPGVPYREMQLELSTKVESEWRTVYDPLLAKMDRGQICAYVLRYKNAAGVFNTDLLHYYAMLGIATRQPSRTHLARDIFKSGQITVVESPIPT